MTYTVIYTRPYMPEPDGSELQKAQVIAHSEQEVRNIYADCSIISIVDNDEQVVNQVISLTTPTTTEKQADAVHDYIEAAEIIDWLGCEVKDPRTPEFGSKEWFDNIKEVPF